MCQLVYSVGSSNQYSSRMYIWVNHFIYIYRVDSRLAFWELLAEHLWYKYLYQYDKASWKCHSSIVQKNFETVLPTAFLNIHGHYFYVLITVYISSAFLNTLLSRFRTENTDISWVWVDEVFRDARYDSDTGRNSSYYTVTRFIRECHSAIAESLSSL